MSTGLAAFDTAVNETNHWLKDLEGALATSERRQAYAAVRAVMHAVRDRLSADGAMRLAAQLPLLLRGAFVEGWRPSETPVRTHTIEAFIQTVAEGLPPKFPHDAEFTARAVIKVWSQLSGGAMAKMQDEIPPAIRALWPAAAPII